MCKLVKTTDNFNKKKSGYQSRCRECQKHAYKAYYDSAPNEKERLYNKNSDDKKIKRDLIQQAKDVPCNDCGIKYPYYVMDFDHRIPSQKSFTIASNISKYSLDQIKNEISKCDIVCANCHRIRTHVFHTGGIGKPT